MFSVCLRGLSSNYVMDLQARCPKRQCLQIARWARAFNLARPQVALEHQQLTRDSTYKKCSRGFLSRIRDLTQKQKQPVLLLKVINQTKMEALLLIWMKFKFNLELLLSCDLWRTEQLPDLWTVSGFIDRLVVSWKFSALNCDLDAWHLHRKSA